MSVASVARNHGINHNILHRWLRELPDPVPARLPQTTHKAVPAFIELPITESVAPALVGALGMERLPGGLLIVVGKQLGRLAGCGAGKVGLGGRACQRTHVGQDRDAPGRPGLYATTRQFLDDMGLNSTRHALHEHHEIDELVEDVQKLDPAGDAWLEKAKELSKEVHHHLREEETKFFQVLAT